MKRSLIIAGLLLCSLTMFAQEEEAVFGYGGLKLTGIWGGPTFGLAGFENENAYLRGGFGGLEFSKKFYIAYAAYWLDDNIEFAQYPDQKLDFRYKGLMLGYSMLSSKVVHPKITFLAAGGRIEFDNEERDNVLVLQPAGGIEVNLFKWLHIDVLGGYRIVSNTSLSEISDSDFSGAFGEIKLNFGISWAWY